MGTERMDGKPFLYFGALMCFVFMLGNPIAGVLIIVSAMAFFLSFFITVEKEETEATGSVCIEELFAWFKKKKEVI